MNSRRPGLRIFSAATGAIVLAALILPSGHAAAAPNDEPSNDPDLPPGVVAIIGASATGDAGHVDLSGTGLVESTFNPDGANSDVGNTDTVGSDPYVDYSVVGDHTFTCDAEGGCPQSIEDAAEEEDLTPADVEALILEAFQSLPVEASPITYQPDGDWAAVNMDFIVYTDNDQQLLDTTILDIPVAFQLTPSHWTWDFGDGSPAVPASRPGAPYPNHTISHVYSSATDGVTVSLTTLWTGQFQIAGTGDWYPVNGFVTTTATAGPVEIVAFDVHLVPNQS